MYTADVTTWRNYRSDLAPRAECTVNNTEQYMRLVNLPYDLTWSGSLLSCRADLGHCLRLSTGVFRRKGLDRAGSASFTLLVDVQSFIHQQRISGLTGALKRHGFTLKRYIGALKVDPTTIPLYSCEHAMRFSPYVCGSWSSGQCKTRCISLLSLGILTLVGQRLDMTEEFALSSGRFGQVRTHQGSILSCARSSGLV